ncbi:MAG: type I restriction enzyme HsdR N-terminal domain-containing protein [Magnetococcales bacterium]|nr:type I restriction enzyme HsdR N-terminal domain-containing protein [Magnetococcales bacterium]
MSNIDELEAMIRKIRDKIPECRKESINEEDTKRVLILPLLQALQWDIHGIREVCSEYRNHRQSNPVDCALLLNNLPCLYVEAKPVNCLLEERKWADQIVSYAASDGVVWCVLTNGDEYRFYNANALGNSESKLYQKVMISDIARHQETVETLALISRENMKRKYLDELSVC